MKTAGAGLTATGESSAKNIRLCDVGYLKPWSGAIDRFTPLVAAFFDLEEPEQKRLFDALERSLSAGAPIPTFDSNVEEARVWASFASNKEHRAYLFAIWEWLPDENRTRFLQWARRRKRTT